MTFCCGIRDKRNVLPIGSCKRLMMKRHTSVFCRFFIKDFPFSKVFVCHRYNRSIREALSWLQFFLYYLHRAFSNAVVYNCMYLYHKSVCFTGKVFTGSGYASDNITDIAVICVIALHRQFDIQGFCHIVKACAAKNVPGVFICLQNFRALQVVFFLVQISYKSFH